MKTIVYPTLVVMVLAGFCGCQKGRLTRLGTLQNATSPSVVASATNQPRYIVHAGGPHSVVEVGQPPEPNQIQISLSERDDPENASTAIFNLTNGSSRSILLWNVRVQVPSKGAGTDGRGWDTVHDDYPSGTIAWNRGDFPPRVSGEFTVPRPSATPWQVCILYSRENTEPGRRAGAGRTWSGNYEVISDVITK